MTAPVVARYPVEREADVVLRDGSTAHVRPIRAEDESALLAFLQSLSPDDRRLRFFSMGADLASAARQEARVDYQQSFGLLATVGPDVRIVAHALYVTCTEGVAEVAFAVAGPFQGQGLASVMLGQLAEVAASAGISAFEALVLPENKRMLGVLRGSGFQTQARLVGDSVVVSFPTSLTPDALERFDQREESASASALRYILRPRTVAVIGASRRPDAVGFAVVRNLLSAGFPGALYPVNPSATTIQGLACFPDVEAIPGEVDLAVIAVPADLVLGVAEACARKGVHALVVLTAGFAEVGAEGQQRQAALLSLCRAAGMRLLGPNCIGVINTDPTAPLNATFGPLMPMAGRIGLASQSGALGLAAIDFAEARGLGFSSVISMGNKADLSGNDLLGYWHTDDRTDVVLLYLESFGNPRRFGRLARAVGRTRPIVVVKSGRGTVGARASASHTGALLASSDVTVDALFRQSGVIRTDTLDQMLDVAALLSLQPLPAGRRVAILTNVGGPGIMCADACEAQRLEVPLLSADTQQQLRSVLPAEVSVQNPVDMLAAATAEQYAECLRILGHDPGVDAVIAIFLPPLATRPEEVAKAMASEVSSYTKPLLGVFVAAKPPPLEARRVPLYQLPEAAVGALASVVRYAEWRQTPAAALPVRTETQPEAVLLVAEALRRGGGWLPPDEVQRLLACYGLLMLEQQVVRGIDSAVAAAAAMGGEVALKAVLPGAAHKSDLGAVQLHLAGADAIRSAAEAVAERTRAALGQPPEAWLVQRMAAPGVEMLVGVVADPRFGPTIACGPGGTLVELLRDVAVRLAPLTAQDAASMLRELRGFPLLDGYRGAPRVAVEKLEDLLVRVGVLASAHPEIAELDCNPVLVTTSDALVIDARVRVAQAQPPRPLGARH